MNNVTLTVINTMNERMRMSLNLSFKDNITNALKIYPATYRPDPSGDRNPPERILTGHIDLILLRLMLLPYDKLENYVTGSWINGDGDGQLLHNAVTGEAIAAATTQGLDFQHILEYGRKKGNPALRKLTFHQRGNMLKALAIHLREHLERFYEISFLTGATRADSWIDIEGGIGNLFANASLRRKFPDESFCLDGETHHLGRQQTFMGTHILVPKEGVAIHINAYNFPVWGMLEKIAVNLLAGVPAVVKPATVTSFLTEAVVREIIASGILPEGALAIDCGSAGDLLDHVGSQDVVTFTGSAATGFEAKIAPRILARIRSFQHGGRFTELYRTGR